MPIRFRKSFKVFPGVKVNMSKGGISFTVGTKGYHLNFSKRGVRQTVGLPGSGLSETSYLVKNDPEPETKRDKSKKDRRTADDLAEEAVEKDVAVRRRSPIWVILLGIVVIYFGAVVLGLIPINFLSQVFQALTVWTRGIGL
jgi:hypothetical protein